MSDAQPSLGLPESIGSADATALSISLKALWANAMGAPVGRLLDDLELSKRWFDPVAQGQRLRRALASLPPAPAILVPVRPPHVIPIGDLKFLVTPEGRCAVDLLDSLPADLEVHLISERQLSRYDRLLAHLYRGWARHRLDSVLELLAGTTKPLQQSAAAVIVALLVNRCTSEDRALIRFGSGPAREVVDEAFFAAVQAFVRSLAGNRVERAGDPRLISGWMLYEAGRRLGESLVIVETRTGKDGLVWIRPGRIERVIEIVGRDLARGHRAKPTVADLGSAYDSLVDVLRENSPRLAGFGLAHERPVETRLLREKLLTALRENLAEKA